MRPVVVEIRPVCVIAEKNGCIPDAAAVQGAALDRHGKPVCEKLQRAGEEALTVVPLPTVTSVVDF